jgi:hypothetical protein
LCRSCRRKTSVTAGTIFHRSRLPLTDWFAAVWFVTSQKNGVSALGLQRPLGIARQLGKRRRVVQPSHRHQILSIHPHILWLVQLRAYPYVRTIAHGSEVVVALSG